MLEPFQSSILTGVPHGFFGRQGGVSQGQVAGLNCGLGSDDDPAKVAENRNRVLNSILPDGQLVGVYQIHSATCMAVPTVWGDDVRPHADALVTDQPGILLGILTADCAPVLLADVATGVVGAAHAGWQGALAGVTDATIAEMLGLGARLECIKAAIGPCIAQSSYEVDAAFRDRFVADDANNAQFFIEGKPDHHQFDLEGYVENRLKMAGITQIELLKRDTYADAAKFYSYRRATHLREVSYGRQISVIGLQ